MALQLWVLLAFAATGVLCQDTCHSITCSSNGFRYAKCLLGRSRPALVTRVEMTRKLSSSSCTFGDSFGIVGNGIFVDDGCRADFNVCFREETCKSMTCSSNSHVYNTCMVDPVQPSLVTLVEITKKLSRSSCTFNRTFGIVDNGIFVDDGCRAEFNVCFFEETCKDMTCSSNGYANNTCKLDSTNPSQVTLVKVIRKISSSSCTLNGSFGIIDNGIWVGAGCRAEFNVCFLEGVLPI